MTVGGRTAPAAAGATLRGTHRPAPDGLISNGIGRLRVLAGNATGKCPSGCRRTFHSPGKSGRPGSTLGCGEYAIPEILRMNAAGQTHSQIAKQFGISSSRVGQILQQARNRALSAERSTAIRNDIQAGDIITLMSDGFAQIWDPGSLSGVYANTAFGSELVKQLLDCGFRDDATFVAIRIR